MNELDLDIPEDFDEFWAEVVSEAVAAPLDFRRFPAHVDAPAHRVEEIEFRGIRGEAINGWIATPNERVRRVPGFLWIAPYGRESVLPNEYGTRKGFASLSFNFHGEGSFHQEKYTPSRGYFADGADSPETWVFRRMFQNAFIAARVFQAQIEVDEDRIAAMGMSQGAGISIWMGAHCPIIKSVVAEMPFLGGIRKTLGRSAYRYPLKELADYMESIPLGQERVFQTLRYFDTAHQATRCSKPTLVSYGLKDPAVRPENAQAIFQALPGAKELIGYDWGHDYHPDMIPNALAWFERHLV